ncbi:MAG: C39 family peptidase [Anaerolineae bacterium]|nr:C39 family peptidase [Anaerolineae bacterium]
MSDAPREMLAHRHAKRPIDPVTVVLGALLLIGLICMAIAGWVVYARQNNRAPIPGIQNTQRYAELNHSLATVSAQSTAFVLAAQTRQAEQSEELERARAELALLGARVAGLEAASEASTVLIKPPLALVLDAPVFEQERSLSCELSAAAMAAHFFDVQVSEADIFAALPFDENPHRGFRGNVDGAYGGLDDYGVYAGPLRQVLTDLGLQVQTFVGGTPELRDHLRHGRVIIAWVTYDLQVQTPREIILSDGEVVTLVPFEHALLVVGYNADGFWVNDPYTGTAKFYFEGEFMRSFAYLDNMALVVGP